MRLILLTLAAACASLPAVAQYEATLAADINPIIGSFPHALIVHDGRLFFRASADDRGDLWFYESNTGQVAFADTADGAGSRPLSNMIVTYRDQLFFQAGDTEHGTELWTYSAATGQASLAADIRPGPGSSSPRDFTVYDDRLFFSATNDESNDFEVWIFDMDTGETDLVADINPSGASFASFFTPYAGRLYFRANNGEEGVELWQFDSKSEVSTLVADINAGTASSSPSDLIVYDDRLFFRADDGESGFELWVYDAATDETALVADIHPGLSGSDPYDLTLYDDRLFFRADDGEHGREIWVFDAASNQAMLAVDIVAGSNDSNPEGFTLYDDRLFFSLHAGGVEGGFEPWYYDAATNQAVQAVDIEPDPFRAADPEYFTVYDGQLYFSAALNGFLEAELWTLYPTPVANESASVPLSVRLHAPHPNPASSEATITFDISEASSVRVEVFDVLGRRVAVLTDGIVAVGEHAVTWDAGSLPSGLYLVRLTVGDTVQTQRLTLAR
jgi:ELWxxDGT repeat protein